TGDVVWDWELPKGNFNEFNRFSIRDYVEMSNGDIVICGLVQEVLDGIWDDSRWTAIAARLSPEGELLWFRRFLVPNETNPEEKGPFHFDILTRVFEREDKTLCFLGESTQFNTTPPLMQYAWILALDEDDCYKGNCNDTIVVDKRLTNKLKFELGATWTYEREFSFRVDFETFEITDTLTIDDMPCFVINNGITFCTDENKILVPDGRLDGGYQLIYDFDEMNNYISQCYDSRQELPIDYDVIVDSVRSESIADNQLINTYYLTNNCVNGSTIYEGIGSSYAQPIACIDFCNDLGDPIFFELTHLRCFENSTESYRFVDYACDSVWMTTSTIDIIQDPFVLYPNPTNDVVYIKDAEHDLYYRLISIQGQVISQGRYTSSGITLPYNGLFYITMIRDDHEWTERVVRY
ncbi:T9SS type A sorting domain-containing protein, partial [Saprospiraceae bacterium]|nr:T9SS type A sorting domain-containing protein [Saprospiraceae bacterium]